MPFKSQFKHLKLNLEDIKLATDNFSESKCIGKGGYGKVYWARMIHSKSPTATFVAVKRLDPKFGQGSTEFWKEVMILSRYNHENLVNLLGYCDDYDEKILVYEYAQCKSLDLNLSNDFSIPSKLNSLQDNIFDRLISEVQSLRYDTEIFLTWCQRLEICSQLARGYAFLHAQGVLHRDIKSSNVLIDEHGNAKISDLGLSKFAQEYSFPKCENHELTYMVTNGVGTHGYCDPVYAKTGILTKASDVYSFGVVLWEVLCGRPCVLNNDRKGQSLIELVRKYYEENRIIELVFGPIKDEITPECLKSFTKIAYQCINRDPEERPSMKEVVKELETIKLQI